MSRSIHLLFADRAFETPAAVALVAGDRHVSYAELHRDVLELAVMIRAAGIRAGNHVAIVLENSVEYVTAYYAALFAGAVPVPLNPAGKPSEIVPIIGHSGARLIFIREDSPALEPIRRACPAVLPVLAQRENSGDWRFASSLVIESRAAVQLETEEVDPNALALLIYTSGTTGWPKGVMLSHANTAANAAGIIASLGLTSAERCLAALPFFYSYGSSVLHTHLAVGATLVIAPKVVFANPVLELIARERVTGLPAVPSLLRLLLGRADTASVDLSSLGYITLAGAATTTGELCRWRKTLPGVRFFVMYGQTEATARLTYLPPEVAEKPGSVGVPLDGVEIEICSETGQRVPRGEHGEICVRGPNVMLGYFKDPEATEAALRGGWLHTGDLGHMDEDGFVYVEARQSSLIKTGAHRVNPREIEEVIARFEGVEEVVAVGVPDELLGEVVHAVIVPTHDAVLEPDAVRAHCARHLAPHKVPKRVSFVPELVKTATGKVVRGAVALAS